ncbi:MULTISPECIES: MFS transporter [Metallosphaera]|uniref:MFS transporter n=1 Tax=Metallosphaera TaxID=41980 RepID=UPI001F06A1AF|nr:MFS transporter [Metallosphaera sedula]MCH1771197.1 MFS transporter [Metallosphaera sedula]MCP6729569.1 MFS transporter [Metallosphaera sedula]
MNRDELFLILSTSSLGVLWGANSLATSLYLRSLGYDPLFIGTILGVGIITGSGVSVLVSILADAYGRKRFILMNRVLSILGIFAFGILRIPFGYLIVNQFGGSLTTSFLADKSKNLERSLSLQTSISQIFVVLGNILGGLLQFRVLYALEIVTLLISLVLVLSVRENYEKREMSFGLKSAGVVGKFAVDSLIGLGAGALLPLISLWFSLAFKVSRLLLTPVFIASQVSLSLGTLIAPRLGEKFGKVKAIVYTHVIAIILLFLIPFSPTFLIASALYVMRNVSMNMTSPLFSSLVLQLVPREERGRAQTLIQLMDSIPRSVGPTLGGYFLSLGVLWVPFVFTGTLYSVSTGLFYFMFRESNLPPRVNPSNSPDKVNNG